jgi:hypothetical protein|tara:strand:+ start:1947 stop:4160 length:2214 start_codon:yes stop_codon:yes gene_type:complete
MATPQLSPGVRIREIDLTVGRAENNVANIGAFAGPFQKGPVEDIADVNTEQDLLRVFGKPLSTDSQYEYWMTAESYLSYGGVMKIVRIDGDSLNNSNVGAGATSVTTKIKNYNDYNDNYSTDSATFVYAAKNPGSWGNGLKVCTIDDLADQTIGINTANPGNLGILIGAGATVALTNEVVAGVGTTSLFSGYLKGIVTGVRTDSIGSRSEFDVKIVSRVEVTGSATTETLINYANTNRLSSFATSDQIFFKNASGLTSTAYSTVNTVVDWYDQQTLGLDNVSIFWKSIAPKPVTNQYSLDRNSKNDAIHVVVVDESGSVTGIANNVIEKHLFLSKSLDAVSNQNGNEKIYWKNYVADNSEYIYAGTNPSRGTGSLNYIEARALGFTTSSGGSDSFTALNTSTTAWNQNAQGITFTGLGATSYSLGGGVDYSATNGMTASLGALNTAYELFSVPDEVDVDFVIGGPSLVSQDLSQAKANKVISIAEGRQDCLATISPHRAGVTTSVAASTKTDNVIEFFAPLSSSSYAVFDSGYKYTYDRFNDEFRYIPCSGDIAGLMARTGRNSFPWFSPAGQQRGVLNNAIKLAYNPSKDQRDQLYANRINPVINKSGTGVLLFGDKTALNYASSFDRINVRRLFLTVEAALQGAADAQLFELNDELTRANFVNIVEPYLRDVQAKRGLYDFLVICDETNNTPDIIDNNEFRADIFLKPTKSINYVTLTFVATRTGTSFSEVAGRV